MPIIKGNEDPRTAMHGVLQSLKFVAIMLIEAEQHRTSLEMTPSHPMLCDRSKL